MKILITEKLDEEGLLILKKHPLLDITISLGLKYQQLLDIIPNFHALVVRSQTKVDEKIIKAGTNLKLIARAGTGLDNIDTKAAYNQAIKVINTPEANSIAVAELTLGLILDLIRKISLGREHLKAGLFERSLFMGQELYNKTLGIIGFGNIGTLVAIRAKSFGMQILSYDPMVKSDYGVSLDELFLRSDIITLHCPLNADTKFIINEHSLKKIKPKSMIINTARGDLIDDQALLNSLNTGHIAMAALDVFSYEPPPKGHILIDHPNVLATPHLGASTIEAQKKVSAILAEKIIEFFKK